MWFLFWAGLISTTWLMLKYLPQSVILHAALHPSWGWVRPLAQTHPNLGLISTLRLQSSRCISWVHTDGQCIKYWKSKYAVLSFPTLRCISDLGLYGSVIVYKLFYKVFCFFVHVFIVELTHTPHLVHREQGDLSALCYFSQHSLWQHIHQNNSTVTWYMFLRWLSHSLPVAFMSMKWYR